MTPERWQKLRSVLEHAMDLAVEDRPGFLDGVVGEDAELRAEVEAMLAAHDEADDRLEQPAVRWAEGLSDLAAGEEQTVLDRPGERGTDTPEEIGPYRLVEKIGQGGMGEVFLAHRSDDYQQSVAIKWLRPGREHEELVRRFLRERQILADLEHPNIAKLMDGGTTEDGRPYLVMEYVKGEPIDVYCRQRRLDVDQRLRLFLAICDGIQFAHQNLVVHRDLKPGNILVTEDGRPKLLDFGIAKILRPESFAMTVLPTQTGMTPMTPEYASPEQIQGQAVTTATDVYALGVLLYELLTGRMPYVLKGGDFKKLVDDICHHPPTRASTAVRRALESQARESRALESRALEEPGVDTAPDELSAANSAPSDEALDRRLAGDLDAILLRALSKDPAERYPSAAQLRDDIERHLRGLPISARGTSFFYTAGKFVRRHRLGVSAGVAALLVLVAVVTALFAQQQRLLDEQERRLLQWQRAESVSAWMLDLFELPAPSRARGERVTARELLDLNARSISEEQKRDPKLHAELIGTIGQTYAQLGLYEEGLQHLRRSVDLHRRQLDSADRPSTVALAARLQQLSDVLTSKGDYRRAMIIAREALSLRRASAVEDGDADVADSLGRLGHLHDLMGDGASASELLDEALAKADGEPATEAKILEYAAEAKNRLGDVDRAAVLYRRALAILEELHDGLHPEISLMKANLARAESWGDRGAAEALLRQAIEEQELVFEGAHPVLATALNNLGLLLYDDARFAESREVLARASRMQEELSGAGHPKVALTLANLANSQAALGELEVAEEHLQRALLILGDRLGEDHADYALCLANLAVLNMRRGDIETAAGLLEQARLGIENQLGPDHPRLTSVLNSLGQVKWARGEAEEARRSLERAVEIARVSVGDRHPVLPSALYNLAVVLTTSDPPAAAERLEEVAALVSARGGTEVFAAEIDTRLADLLLNLERHGEAETRARAAVDAWLELAGENNLWTLSAQAPLGLAILRQGRAEEAAPILIGRLERLEASQPPTSKRLHRAYEYVIELYEALGDRARADRYRERLSKLPPPR